MTGGIVTELSTARDARWHVDARTIAAAECVTEQCTPDTHLEPYTLPDGQVVERCALCHVPADAHTIIRVRGAHSTERFSCEHKVETIVWHELTPVDHPDPSCEHGCTMTVQQL